MRLLILFLFIFSFPAQALEDEADRIEVIKSKRIMKLYQGKKVIRSYKIGLGRNPVGRKEKLGDNKTPEGVYYISGRNDSSAFYLSLKISYPNEDDIKYAEKKGYDAGNNIMIHGEPKDPKIAPLWGKKRDWTAGCIAVTNEEIKEIWNLVPDGTVIEIKP